VGSLEQVRVPRLRGEEIGCWSATAAWLDEAVRSDRRRLSQRKVWTGAAFLGGRFRQRHWRGLRASATADCAAAQRADPARDIVPRGGWNYLRYRRSVSQPHARVLLVAWRARRGGFDVLDWRGRCGNHRRHEELLTQLWRRGLESVELIVSDGLPAWSARRRRCISGRHQLCLAHWFRHLRP